MLSSVLSRLSHRSGLSPVASLDGRKQPMSPEIRKAVDLARERSSYELLSAAMVGQIIVALAVYVVLRSRLPANVLQAWLIARVGWSLVRMVHARSALRGWLPRGFTLTSSLVVMATLDGALWGVLGWGMTPLFQMEVSVVTIPVLVAMACLAAFMLYPISPAALGFIYPVLLPNALYAAGRHDDLGYFCLISVLGLAAALTFEVLQNKRRLIELLRLRFESEQLSQIRSEALREAKSLAEAKSRFMATMSHEMRTPLHGILGLVRMVRHESRDPQLARHLGLIQSSGEHLMSVINDVLDYSKLEAGKLPVHRVPFPLHDMLTELVDTYQPACRDKGLQFEAMLEIAADEWVDGDATRLRQILHNLVSNAVKFTARGHVSLRAWRPDAGDAVVFEVRDSGIGIAPQDLPRVFDAFYQAEAASDRRYGGTGLGLTISRDLCRAMGGQLRCDSKMGQGTVFICQLPLPRAMSRQADGGARTAERARRADRGFAFDLSVLVEPHVLLVEDNPVNALVAQAELGRLGVRVTMVDNGPDALGVLERELVDLVLMDCEMPGMDGIETTRRIREAERAQRRPAVTIVALTASGRDVYIERCVPAGMNGYLLKPFKSEELADIVTRHVRTQLCEV